MKKLTMKAERENIPEVIDFIDRELDELGCSEKTKAQINIAIDELYGNIASYAYGEENGEVTVIIEGDSTPGAVSISFQDEGKPFNPLELMARVKTQLRRYTRYNMGGAPEEAPSELTIRGLTIDRDTPKVRLHGSELVLTPIEFSILRYLCEHRGKVVTSEELYEKVWGEEFLDCNNTVMAHIARLRSKMHEPSRRPKYIKTVWGVGYTIE